MARRAASAEPRAPAMSRSGTRAKVATFRCSSRSSVDSCTPTMNQARKLGRGLGHAATDEVGVRVGEVGGDA